MAIEVAKLYATIGGDTAGLKTAVNESEGLITGHVNSMNNLLKQGFSFAAGFAGLQGVMGIFGNLKDTIISTNSQLEQATLTFARFTGGTEQAKVFLGELQTMAANTPFEFPDLLQGAERLMNFGVAAKDVLPLLTNIGDVAGGNAERIQRMSLAFGQMLTIGKIQGDELNQLAEAGVSVTEVMDVMAKQTGKSREELSKLQQAGKLASTDFLKAFQEWASVKWGGAMAQQAQTFQGAVSTIKDSLTQLVATAFKPFFELTSAGLQQFAKAVQTEQFTSFAKSVATAMENLVKTLLKLVEVGKPLLIGFAAFATVLLTVATAAGVLSPVLGVLATAIGVLTSPLGAVALAVGVLAGAFASNFLGIRDTVMRVVQPVMNILGGLRELLMGGYGDKTELLKAIEGLFPANVATAIAHGTDAIQSFVRALTTKDVSAFNDMAQSLRNAFGPEMGDRITRLAAKLLEFAGHVRDIAGGLGEALSTGNFANLAKALDEVFKPETTTQILQMVEGFKKFAETLRDKLADIGPAALNFLIEKGFPALVSFGEWIVDHAPGAVEKLGGFIGHVKDLADAVGTLGPALEKANPGLKEFGKTLQDVSGSMTKEQGDALEAMAKGIGTLAESLGRFGTVNKGTGGQLSDLANGLAILGTALFAIGSLPTAGMELVARAIGGLATALAGLLQAQKGLRDLYDDLFKLGTIIGTALDTNNWDEVGDKLGKIFEKLKTDVQNIWEGLVKTIQGLWDATGGNLYTTIKTWAENVGKVFEGLKELLVGHSIVPEMIDDIIKEFGRLTTILGPLGEFKDKVTGAFEAIGKAVGDKLGNLFGSKGGDKTVPAFDFKSYLGLGSDGGASTLPDLSGAVADMGAKAQSALADFGANFAAGFATIKESVGAIVGAMVADVLAQLQAMAAGALAAITDLTTSATAAIEAFHAAVVASLQAMAAEGLMAITEFGTGLVSALEVARNAAEESVATLVANIIALLKGLADSMREVGLQAAAGLAAGIRAGIPDVEAAAAELAAAASNASAVALEEHSASKVFERQGANIPLGLANGIRTSSYIAGEEAKKLAALVQDQFDQQITRGGVTRQHSVVVNGQTITGTGFQFWKDLRDLAARTFAATGKMLPEEIWPEAANALAEWGLSVALSKHPELEAATKGPTGTWVNLTKAGAAAGKALTDAVVAATEWTDAQKRSVANQTVAGWNEAIKQYVSPGQFVSPGTTAPVWTEEQKRSVANQLVAGWNDAVKQYVSPGQFVSPGTTRPIWTEEQTKSVANQLIAGWNDAVGEFVSPGATRPIWTPEQTRSVANQLIAGWNEAVGEFVSPGATAPVWTPEQTKSVANQLTAGWNEAVQQFVSPATSTATAAGNALGAALSQGVGEGVTSAAQSTANSAAAAAAGAAAAMFVAVGAHSPAEATVPLGESLMEGIMAGVDSMVKPLADKVANALKTAFLEPSSGILGDVGATISAWAAGVGVDQWVGQFFMQLKGHLPENITELNAFLKDIGAQGYEQYRPGTTPTSGILDAFNKLLADANDPIKRLAKGFGDIGEAAKTAAAPLKAVFDVFSDILDKASTVAASGLPNLDAGNKALDAARSLLRTLRQIGTGEATDALSVFTQAYRDLGTITRQLAPGMAFVDQVKTLAEGFKGLGLAMPESLARAIQAVGDSLGGPFKDAVDAILAGPASSPAQTALTKLKATLDEFDLAERLGGALSAAAGAGITLPPEFLDLLRSLSPAPGGVLDQFIDKLLNDPKFQAIFGKGTSVAEVAAQALAAGVPLVQVNVENMASDMDIELLARRVAGAIAQA